MKPVINAFGMISHWIPNESIEIKNNEQKKSSERKPSKKGVK